MTTKAISNRIGRFKVDARHFYRARAEDLPGGLFKDVAVIRANHDFLTDTIEYWAVCKHFRPIDEGEVLPEYRAIFDDGQTVPRWEEIKP